MRRIWLKVWRCTQHLIICDYIFLGLLWKVYRGTKKTTKQEASVFVLEKKSLDRYSKDDREQLLEILRKSVVQLTKLRHPHILTIQHPLEESRDSISFATEPCFASLANVLGNVSEFYLEEWGVYRNICPESIMINQGGAWKIFGFDYCILNQNPHDAKAFWPFQEFNPTWQALAQPSLEYMVRIDGKFN